MSKRNIVSRSQQEKKLKEKDEEAGHLRTERESKQSSSSRQSLQEAAHLRREREADLQGSSRGMSSGRGTMNPGGRGRGRSRSTGGRGRGTMNQSEEAPIYNSTLERPIYSCKVNELRPGTMGHSLTVKVLTSTLITTASQTPLAECLVGDDTAVILFTARGSQGK